jgi:isopentenyl diphosphate isomerase/L-lactate dehydrogenase-like FMN-dependent dehydrogenase
VPNLSRVFTVSEMRLHARRRLPRMVFDAIDGGTDDEWTLRANEAAFDSLTFAPQLLRSVPGVRTGIELFGDALAMPLILSPTGAAGLAHPDGEIGVARAAREAGIIATAPTVSSHSLEEIAKAVPGSHWFQLYAPKDRSLAGALIDKVRKAGYRVLLITVDTNIPANFVRNLRNGMTRPLRITLRNSADVLLKIPWLWGQVRGPGFTVPNVANLHEGAPKGGRYALEYMHRVHNPEQTWDDIAWIKERWGGPVGIKGIMTAADAVRAREVGMDTIVVSNHGGRALDGLPATVEVLPEIVAALEGSGMPILIDGGVRRGSDIAKALALGATACMIGRPWIWGLSVGGTAGASRVLQILRTELERTVAKLGETDVRNLTPALVRRH